MPVIALLGAGFLGGMWVRSEFDSTGGSLVKWAAIAGAGYLAYRHFRG